MVLLSSLFSEFSCLEQDLQARIWTYLGPLGINQICFCYLLFIDVHAPCRIGELVEAFHMDKASVTRSMATLGKLGFVNKQSDKAQSRAVVLILSAAGKAVVRKTEELTREWEADLRAAMRPGEYDAALGILCRARKRFVLGRAHDAAEMKMEREMRPAFFI